MSHTAIHQLLAELERAQPPSIDVNLYCGGSPKIGLTRGTCHFNDPRPVASDFAEATEPPPADDSLKATKQVPVTDLRVDDFIHVEVRSPLAGYFHLHNLALSGDDGVAALLPDANSEPPLIEANRFHYLHEVRTAAGYQFCLTQLWENATVPSLQEDGNGLPTEEPERLLVVVTKEKEVLLPALLRGTKTRGGFWDSVKASCELLRLPTNQWAWGLASAQVQPRD